LTQTKRNKGRRKEKERETSLEKSKRGAAGKEE
jgi:hypothetical protein